MMITGAQIRAGRAFAKLSANELATRARIGRTTVVRAELGDGIPSTTAANLFAIQRALEATGVIFGPDGSVSYRSSAGEQ
jgi:transcriptional regulator with XRE-family HTH domain